MPGVKKLLRWGGSFGKGWSSLALLFLGLCFSGVRSAQASAITLVQRTPSGHGLVSNPFPSNTTAGDTIVTCADVAMTSGSSNSLASVTGQGTFTIVSSTLINSGAETFYTNMSFECAYATGIVGGSVTNIQCTWTSGGISEQDCDAYELTSCVTKIFASTGRGAGISAST